MTEFGQRIVAFIDILGFSDHVSKIGSANDEGYKQVRDAINYVSNTAESFAEKYNAEDTHLCVFSDSVFISCPQGDDKQLHFVLSAAQEISYELLRVGFFCRGGVEIGPCFHDKNRIFGGAATKAVKLEAQIAQNPRIILSKSVAEMVRNSRIEESSLVRKSKDGPRYIHSLWPITHLADLVVQKKEPKWRESIHFQTASKLREYLKQGLHDHQDAPRIFSKYAWYAQYFNQEVATFRHTLGMDWPDQIDIWAD